MVNRSNGRMPQRGFSQNFGETRKCMNCNNTAPSHGDACTGVSADCKAMMRRLKTVEFAMYDIMLYLDIYPECSEALAYYHKLLEERDALRVSLAKKCKRPTTAAENACSESWDWIASPWPWDPSAN